MPGRTSASGPNVPARSESYSSSRRSTSRRANSVAEIAPYPPWECHRPPGPFPRHTCSARVTPVTSANSELSSSVSKASSASTSRPSAAIFARVSGSHSDP